MNGFAGSPSRALDPGRFNAEAEKSFTLPADWYYREDVFTAEHEAIFYRGWIYQCHESDLAAPGDYYAGSVMDQGVFVIRGADGVIRAFYNVCSHRAHPLVEGTGCRERLVCPYHQWSYDIEGRFLACRGKEALQGWVPENADLKPVRVESLGGMLFVNLDPEATPLETLTGPFAAHMREACPRLDDLRRLERFEIDIPANWKTVIDNNHECYHCQVNHRSLMEGVNYASKAEWTDYGITFSHKVSADPELEKAGCPWQPDVVEQRSLFGFVWPSTIPLFFPGPACLAVFQVIPTGPETTRERWDFCFASDEVGEQERRFIDYITRVLIVEDSGLCANVQRGLHSRGYRQGRLVVDRTHPYFSEHHVHFFQKLVHDALLEAGRPRASAGGG